MKSRKQLRRAAAAAEAGTQMVGAVALAVSSTLRQQNDDQAARIETLSAQLADERRRNERTLHALAEARQMAARLATAIDITRQYVGGDVLPAVEGWAWFDATQAWQQYEAGMWHPTIRGDNDDDQHPAAADPHPSAPPPPRS